MLFKALVLSGIAAITGGNIYEDYIRPKTVLSVVSAPFEPLVDDAENPDVIQEVKTLLEGNADPNLTDESGYTPLHYAAINGYKGITKLLIEHKALIVTEINTGKTPLHEAAYYHNNIIIQQLLDGKADPNKQSKRGNTPVHAAAFHHNHEGLKLLIKAGGNVNQRNKDQQTPLDVTVKKSSLKCIQLLLHENGQFSQVTNESV